MKLISVDKWSQQKHKNLTPPKVLNIVISCANDEPTIAIRKSVGKSMFFIVNLMNGLLN